MHFDIASMISVYSTKGLTSLFLTAVRYSFLSQNKDKKRMVTSENNILFLILKIDFFISEIKEALGMIIYI